MRGIYSWRGGVTVFVCVAVAMAGVGFLRARRRSLSAELGRPRDLHVAQYAGSAACARCHPEHDASWRRTFHRTMTQDVSGTAPAGVVAGDFSGATYRYGDVEARMHRDATGQYLMTFTSASAVGPGAVVDAAVVRAVGSRRYQQYLADVGGALWRLPMAYHVQEKRWFHMNGAFLTPDPTAAATNPDPHSKFPSASDRAPAPAPAAPRFGGGAFDRHVTRWNDNCVFCHNVAPNPRLDPGSGTFRTSVAELGVACEACHGPASEHVRLNEDPLRRYTLHLAGTADPTVVNPSRLSPSRSADLCGRCHGQRMSDDVAAVMAHGDPFVPGDDLALYSAPLWQDTTLHDQPGVFAARFWDDGTPRLTAYEYQGLLESACSQRGPLTCTTCHGMHDGDPRGQLRPAAAAGDGACTSCHKSLTSATARAQHSHHDPAGAGARCVSCHMPRIVYGVLDIHPSHRIEIPDPARAIARERPDACTLCHVDASRAWAVGAFARLWPRAGSPQTPRAATPDPPGGDDDALSPGDAVFAGDPVVRAIAADALGRAPWPLGFADADQARGRRVRTLLDVMTNDRYPAIRHLAARALSVLVSPTDAAAGALVSAFDATAPSADRARTLTMVRERLGPHLSNDSNTDVLRIAALRRRAARADIDIGE